MMMMMFLSAKLRDPDPEVLPLNTVPLLWNGYYIYIYIYIYIYRVLVGVLYRLYLFSVATTVKRYEAETILYTFRGSHLRTTAFTSVQFLRYLYYNLHFIFLPVLARFVGSIRWHTDLVEMISCPFSPCVMELLIVWQGDNLRMGGEKDGGYEKGSYGIRYADMERHPNKELTFGLFSFVVVVVVNLLILKGLVFLFFCTKQTSETKKRKVRHQFFLQIRIKDPKNRNTILIRLRGENNDMSRGWGRLLKFRMFLSCRSRASSKSLLMIVMRVNKPSEALLLSTLIVVFQRVTFSFLRFSYSYLFNRYQPCVNRYLAVKRQQDSLTTLKIFFCRIPLLVIGLYQYYQVRVMAVRFFYFRKYCRKETSTADPAGIVLCTSFFLFLSSFFLVGGGGARDLAVKCGTSSVRSDPNVDCFEKQSFICLFQNKMLHNNRMIKNPFERSCGEGEKERNIDIYIERGRER
eukprot:gene9348-6571_t